MKIVIQKLSQIGCIKHQFLFWQVPGSTYKVYVKTIWAGQIFYFIETDAVPIVKENNLNQAIIMETEKIIYQKADFILNRQYHLDKVWLVASDGSNEVLEVPEKNREALPLLRGR